MVDAFDEPKRRKRKVAECHPTLAATAFEKCKPCYDRDRSIKRRMSGQRRERMLRDGHGLTVSEYELLFDRQGGLCAICRRVESATRNGYVKMLAVDHDHNSGQIRGLLCQRCNLALGLFEDDPEVLQRAVLYVGL